MIPDPTPDDLERDAFRDYLECDFGHTVPHARANVWIRRAVHAERLLAASRSEIERLRAELAESQRHAKTLGQIVEDSRHDCFIDD